MKKSQLDKIDLSSYAPRKQYPSLEISMQAMKYKNERLDYWFTQECECPYTEAAKDVERMFGHLLQVR